MPNKVHPKMVARFFGSFRRPHAVGAAGAEETTSVKFTVAEVQALGYAWGLSRTMLSNSYAYLYIGHALFITILVLTLGTIVSTTWFSVIDEDQQEEVGLGSVALSLCTTAHPLYTGFANIFGASISETTMRPNPRWGGKSAGCTRCTSSCHS
jgi:hypothetical protein